MACLLPSLVWRRRPCSLHVSFIKVRWPWCSAFGLWSWNSILLSAHTADGVWLTCRIMIGFMLPSWFLSMWLSNTATTGMMIPVAEKVIEEMWRQLRNRKPTTAASFTALYGVGWCRRIYAIGGSRCAVGRPLFCVLIDQSHTVITRRWRQTSNRQTAQRDPPIA